MTEVEVDHTRRGVVLIGESEVRQLFGLPADTELLAMWAEPSTCAIKVLVRSAELEPVAPGCEAPLLDASWTRELHIDEDGEAWIRWRLTDAWIRRGRT